VLQLPETWAIGQRAEVFIETARVDECVWVPVSLLAQQGTQLGVFINDRGIAKWRPLSLGIEGRDAMEVLAGLQPGDLAIMPAQAGAKLDNGRRVFIP
jgi:hypothetical protein